MHFFLHGSIWKEELLLAELTKGAEGNEIYIRLLQLIVHARRPISRGWCIFNWIRTLIVLTGCRLIKWNKITRPELFKKLLINSESCSIIITSLLQSCSKFNNTTRKKQSYSKFWFFSVSLETICAWIFAIFEKKSIFIFPSSVWYKWKIFEKMV